MAPIDWRSLEAQDERCRLCDGTQRFLKDSCPLCVWEPREPEGLGWAAGQILSLPFEKVAADIVGELRACAKLAPLYPLDQSCLPQSELLARYRAIADGTCPRKDADWKGLACLRISDTWKSRSEGTIWLDDKVAQVQRITEFFGESLHLPLLAHAQAVDVEGIEAVRAEVRRCVAADEPIVVKPRHGANSKRVFVWPNPRQAGEAAVVGSVDQALGGQDRSWDKENWQLWQVPRGVVVQPLYRTEMPDQGTYLGNGELTDKQGLLRFRPLELSVLVISGVVAASVLNMHPLEVWVTREGAIQQWLPEDLKAFGVPGSAKYCKPSKLPAFVVDALQVALRRDWSRIREASERLVRLARLDELRVDWLLGDEQWGARIGEVTYMGAGSRFCVPGLAGELAQLFVGAHLRREQT